MLIVVIVVLVWVAGIMLFIKPSIEDMNDAQTNLDNAKATLSDLQDRIEKDKDLDKRIDKAYKEVNALTDSFYSYQQTQLATQEVDNLLKSDNIVNSNMTISQYATYSLSPYAVVSQRAVTPMDVQIEEYKNQKVAADDGEEDSAAASTTTTDTTGEGGIATTVIGAYTISFDFEGEISDLKSFCEKLRTSNTEKTMIVVDLEYEFVEEEGEKKEGEREAEKVRSDSHITGTMSLQMLVVEKLPDPSTL